MIGQRVKLVLEYPRLDDLVADYYGRLCHGEALAVAKRSLTAGTPVTLYLQAPGLRRPVAIRGEVGPPAELDGAVRVVFREAEMRHHLWRMVTRIVRRDPEVVRKEVRLLVVEDNVHVQRLVSTGLRNSFSDIGLDIRTAEDGREALAVLQAERFVAAIVDVYLPSLDGGKLIGEIRRNDWGRDLQVLAVSAGGASARLSALSAGANAFLAKPVRLRELVSWLTPIFDRHVGNSGRPLRRYPRYRTHVPGEVRLPEGGSARPCSISQISLGGAFIDLDESFRPGAAVRVVLGQGPVGGTALAAEVRYCLPENKSPSGRQGIGVAWGALSGGARAHLERVHAQAIAACGP